MSVVYCSMNMSGDTIILNALVLSLVYACVCKIIRKSRHTHTLVMCTANAWCHQTCLFQKASLYPLWMGSLTHSPQFQFATLVPWQVLFPTRNLDQLGRNSCAHASYVANNQLQHMGWSNSRVCTHKLDLLSEVKGSSAFSPHGLQQHQSLLPLHHLGTSTCSYSIADGIRFKSRLQHGIKKHKGQLPATSMLTGPHSRAVSQDVGIGVGPLHHVQEVERLGFLPKNAQKMWGFLESGGFLGSGCHMF